MEKETTKWKVISEKIALNQKLNPSQESEKFDSEKPFTIFIRISRNEQGTFLAIIGRI